MQYLSRISTCYEFVMRLAVCVWMCNVHVFARIYVYVNVQVHTVEENSQDELNKQREQFFSASDLNV